MVSARENPVELFSNPLKVASLLMKQGHAEPFERGARFNLIGGNGERHQFVHSAQSLCEARDTLQALTQVQGGANVSAPAVQNVQDVRPDTPLERS